MNFSVTEQSKKKKYKTVILVVIIVLSILSIMHIIKVYTLLFENQIAFIYHPSTDTFFVVEVEPLILSKFKWQYLNPFKSIEYGHVDFIQYKGKLSEALSQREKFYNIYNNNSDLLSEKLDEIERRDLERLHELMNELEFSYIYSWKRLEQDPKPLIPDAWQEILNNVKSGEKGGLYVADVLFMRITKNGPRDIAHYPNSLIVKPPAAGELMNLGFHEYLLFDEIW